MTIEIFSSGNIDMKSAGATPVFTPSGDFVVTAISFVAVDVTGATPAAVVSIGNNATSYDNFISALPTYVNADDRCQVYSIGGTVNNVIQSGNQVNVKLVVVDSTATTNVQRVDILGYYI